MPAQNLDDLPIAAQMGDYVARVTQEWGDMTVSYETLGGASVGMDTSPLFQGLPDDRCQAHHWGYLLKGKMEYRYADRVETVSAGQVYYVQPGHIPHVVEDAASLEFSRTEEIDRTREVTRANGERMFGGDTGGGS